MESKFWKIKNQEFKKKLSPTMSVIFINIFRS
jgi:hypothetical protein